MCGEFSKFVSLVFKYTSLMVFLLILQQEKGGLVGKSAEDVKKFFFSELSKRSDKYLSKKTDVSKLQSLLDNSVYDDDCEDGLADKCEDLDADSDSNQDENQENEIFVENVEELESQVQ